MPSVQNSGKGGIMIGSGVANERRTFTIAELASETITLTNETMPRVFFWFSQAAAGVALSAQIQFNVTTDGGNEWLDLEVPIALVPGTPFHINRFIPSAGVRVVITNPGGGGVLTTEVVLGCAASS